MVNKFQASRIKVLRTGFLKKFKKYLYAGLLSVCFRVLVFFQKVPEFIKRKEGNLLTRRKHLCLGMSLLLQHL